VTRERVRELLASGASISEIARRLGLAKSTACYHARRLGNEADPRFARRFDWNKIRSFYESGHTPAECREEFGFSAYAWYEAIRRGAVVPRRPTEELALLTERTDVNRGSLKRLLIDAGVKSEACERCGISEWRGRRLSIALHHINGDPLDNRVENLSLLCPNCHSQTENYGGRNARLRRVRQVA
jgi:hypothetical protein